MDLNPLRIVVTLLGFVLFVCLMVWTWRPSRRGAHDAAARLPFDGEAATTDASTAPNKDRQS